MGAGFQARPGIIDADILDGGIGAPRLAGADAGNFRAPFPFRIDLTQFGGDASGNGWRVNFDVVHDDVSWLSPQHFVLGRPLSIER